MKNFDDYMAARCAPYVCYAGSTFLKQFISLSSCSWEGSFEARGKDESK